MPGVGPVDGVQVGLRRLPSHAAVLVRAVKIRRETLILKRSSDRSDRAVGHEISEDAARTAINEDGHDFLGVSTLPWRGVRRAQRLGRWWSG